MDSRDTQAQAPPRPRANRGNVSGPESARYHESGMPRRMPFDLQRSRQRGTMNNPGPLPFFGPLTIIEGSGPMTNPPHRCVACGRRDHAGKDCPFHTPD